MRLPSIAHSNTVSTWITLLDLFHVVLHVNCSNSLVVCRYHVEVYAMERIHVKATVGQGCKVPLVLRGTGTMNVHTSHPHEFTVPEAVNVQGGLQQANLVSWNKLNDCIF